MTQALDSVLRRIVERRAADIGREFGGMSPADLERLACGGRPVRDFEAALSGGPHVGVIAEVKKASPSEGPIAPDREASVQALAYERGGAAAISVLTEPAFFGGSYADLSDVADSSSLPVLAKDFVVDPAQLFASRGHGADAVLLIAGVLGERLPEFLDVARTLGMDALVEVVDEAELEAARAAGATLVGVNARDLRTLAVDREAALRLVRLTAEAGFVTVAASGVSTASHVRAAAGAGAHAVLVGTALMRSTDPAEAVAALQVQREAV